MLDGRLLQTVGWVITVDEEGAGEVIAQGSESLGTRQMAFDAEITAIERALAWFMASEHERRSLVIRSDSTSVIARAGHTGAGPGQQHALGVQDRKSVV